MSASKKALSGNHHEHARPNPVEGCPLTAALAAIGGKWKLSDHLNLLFSTGRDIVGDTHAMAYVGLQVLTK